MAMDALLTYEKCLILAAIWAVIFAVLYAFYTSPDKK